jgi:hypothetical protein
VRATIERRRVSTDRSCAWKAKLNEKSDLHSATGWCNVALCHGIMLQMAKESIFMVTCYDSILIISSFWLQNKLNLTTLLEIPVATCGNLTYVIILRCFWNWVTFCGYYKTSSAVGTGTGYELECRGVRVRVPVGSIIFTSPYRRDCFWGQSSVLSNG